MTVFKVWPLQNDKPISYTIVEWWYGPNLLGTAQELKDFDEKGRPGFKLRGFKHASPRGVQITISP